MSEPIDWKHRAANMAERHGVLPEEADEAVQDVDALWFDPDPKSRSGDSVRVIGYSHTAKAVLTVTLGDVTPTDPETVGVDQLSHGLAADQARGRSWAAG